MHDRNYKEELNNQKRLIKQCIKDGSKYSTIHEEMHIEEFLAREIELNEANQKRFQAVILLFLKNQNESALKNFGELIKDVLNNFAEEAAESFIIED